MTKEEFSIFASALRTYYPKENILPNAQALELWYNQLNDIPYNVANATLYKWVATNKWSPSIADIREQATILVNGSPKDWGAAWDEVQQAIRHYGSWNAEKALESLDDITRATVKRIGFYNLCTSENPTADRANFRIIYEEIEKRQRTEQQIPPKLKALINNITLQIGEGGQNEK